MLAFQRARQAIKARPGAATLVQSPTAVPIYHTRIQHRAIHDKTPNDNEVIKQAKGAVESPEDSTQDPSTFKVTKPFESAAAVSDRVGDLSGDEFWRKVPVWKDVKLETFISYRWTVRCFLDPGARRIY